MEPRWPRKKQIRIDSVLLNSPLRDGVYNYILMLHLGVLNLEKMEIVFSFVPIDNKSLVSVISSLACGNCDSFTKLPLGEQCPLFSIVNLSYSRH